MILDPIKSNALICNDIPAMFRLLIDDFAPGNKWPIELKFNGGMAIKTTTRQSTNYVAASTSKRKADAPSTTSNAKLTSDRTNGAASGTKSAPRHLTALTLLAIAGQVTANGGRSAMGLSTSTPPANIPAIPPGPPMDMLANYKKFAGKQTMPLEDAAKIARAGGKTINREGWEQLLLTVTPRIALDTWNYESACGSYAKDAAVALDKCFKSRSLGNRAPGRLFRKSMGWPEKVEAPDDKQVMALNAAQLAIFHRFGGTMQRLAEGQVPVPVAVGELKADEPAMTLGAERADPFVIIDKGLDELATMEARFHEGGHTSASREWKPGLFRRLPAELAVTLDEWATQHLTEKWTGNYNGAAYPQMPAKSTDGKRWELRPRKGAIEELGARAGEKLGAKPDQALGIGIQYLQYAVSTGNVRVMQLITSTWNEMYQERVAKLDAGGGTDKREFLEELAGTEPEPQPEREAMSMTTMTLLSMMGGMAMFGGLTAIMKCIDGGDKEPAREPRPPGARQGAQARAQMQVSHGREAEAPLVGEVARTQAGATPSVDDQVLRVLQPFTKRSNYEQLGIKTVSKIVGDTKQTRNAMTQLKSDGLIDDQMRLTPKGTRKLAAKDFGGMLSAEQQAALDKASASYSKPGS